ncbi:Uncharacterized protein HZ326_18298 [Fusarium oxysporum f. sp. albedinis]|nr:Uncharacterized protein HZ326_18298 [Fusarium oxysporum f. sp. albedinis]
MELQTQNFLVAINFFRPITAVRYSQDDCRLSRSPDAASHRVFKVFLSTIPHDISVRSNSKPSWSSPSSALKRSKSRSVRGYAGWQNDMTWLIATRLPRVDPARKCRSTHSVR